MLTAWDMSQSLSMTYNNRDFRRSRSKYDIPINTIQSKVKVVSLFAGQNKRIENEPVLPRLCVDIVKL